MIKLDVKLQKENNPGRSWQLQDKGTGTKNEQFVGGGVPMNAAFRFQFDMRGAGKPHGTKESK